MMFKLYIIFKEFIYEEAERSLTFHHMRETLMQF